MLIDWKSTVTHGEKSWSNFLVDRSPPPVAMRVYLKHSHRFAEPHDELSFVAFEVSARESERTIFAYTPRESEIARQLANAVPIELNGSGRTPHGHWNEADTEIVYTGHYRWLPKKK